MKNSLGEKDIKNIRYVAFPISKVDYPPVFDKPFNGRLSLQPLAVALPQHQVAQVRGVAKHTEALSRLQNLVLLCKSDIIFLIFLFENADL